MTDEEARTRLDERAWAQKLAAKFSSHPPPDESESSAFPTSDPARAAAISPEESVRELNYAEEFRYRKRPGIWWYILACVAMQAPVIVVCILFPGPPIGALLVLSGFIAVRCYFWCRRAAPICPRCRQNIRVCLQEFCHICGKRMYEGRCTDCGVDNTWTSWFQPYRSGSFRWITYCPGCGVELDTSIRRWRAGD